MSPKDTRHTQGKKFSGDKMWQMDSCYCSRCVKKLLVLDLFLLVVSFGVCCLGFIFFFSV